MKEKTQEKKGEDMRNKPAEEKPEGGNVGVVERGDKDGEGGAGHGEGGASIQRPPADS